MTFYSLHSQLIFVCEGCREIFPSADFKKHEGHPILYTSPVKLFNKILQSKDIAGNFVVDL